MPTYKPINAEEQVHQSVLALWREVIKTSSERSQSDKVSGALLYFLVRVANTWTSIWTLRANTSDAERFMVDAGVLLRVMFDAYLQAEYLVHDPNVQIERAREYLDFEIVERYKAATRVIGHDHPFSQTLRASAKRAAGEKALLDEYNRVKDKYLEKPGASKTRDRWYRGSLATVARAIGKEAEYDFFVSTFHGCVHSSAFAIHKGPPMSPQYVAHWGSMFAARVARINVEYNRIVLTVPQQQLLEALCKDFAEMARSAAR